MTASYAWPLTVTAAADLHLHVSTAHRHFGVRLFRCGATEAEVSGPRQIFTGVDLPLGRPDEAWGWPDYPISLDEELEDGVYVAVPVAASADVANRKDACLFILRRSPASDRQIWYKLPTATYTAYNQIGGASLYAGAQWARDWTAQGYVASLQRPGNGGVGGRVM